MYVFEIDLREWKQFARQIADKEPLRRHLLNALDGCLDLLEFHISAETPVNTGMLRASWSKERTVKVIGREIDLWGAVVTAIPYGWPMEVGRKPGRMPPVSAIAYWVRRKQLAETEEEIQTVAFLIARAIGRRGTQGAFMVEKATKTVEQSGDMTAIWEYELQQYLKEVALAR